jgi:hypothetical protein
LNQKFSLNLLRTIHDFYFNEIKAHLKTLMYCIKDRERLIQAMLSFTLVISHVEAASNEVIKKVVVLLPIS